MGNQTQKNVAIYSTPSCHYCHLAKAFFKKNNIEFTDYDVTTSPDKRQEMIEKTGQLGVPVIEVDGELTIGFNEKHLRTLLGM